MPMANLYHQASMGPISFLGFCVDGPHVQGHQDGGIAIPAPRYTVTLCDGSCKEKPVLKTTEIPEDLVKRFRGMLGRSEPSYLS